MIDYIIECCGDEYNVFLDDLIVLKAKRKRTLIGDVVYFRGIDGCVKYCSKHIDILGVWTIYHKVTFEIDKHISRIISTTKGNGLTYKDVTYTIGFRMFGPSPILYIDLKPNNSLLKVIAAESGKRKVLVRSNDALTCEIFAVLYIALDWFDVN